MLRAAVDIGTNSMRLLIVDAEGGELIRLERVTGLGRGADATRRLSEEAIDRTLAVLAQYGRLMDEHQARRRAVATSATRDAVNRDEFLDRAEAVLGVRPDVVTGDQEAALAYAGATAERDGSFVVVDIGGGSTEFVYEEQGIRSLSVDIGSVRLTERMLGDRPAAYEDVEAAIEHVDAMFGDVAVPDELGVVGVSGTWTSLAAIAAGAGGSVHDAELDRLTVDRLVVSLAGLSLEETAALPGLDPARAPVILSGAVIAREVMRTLAAESVVVSERDLLDGVVAAL